MPASNVTDVNTTRDCRVRIFQDFALVSAEDGRLHAATASAPASSLNADP